MLLVPLTDADAVLGASVIHRTRLELLTIMDPAVRAGLGAIICEDVTVAVRIVVLTPVATGVGIGG
jgi:hypothetical protein